jgi:hypothetical protein
MIKASSPRIALVAVLAVAVLAVGVAHAPAAPTQSKAQWYTGSSPGSVTALGGGVVKAAPATIAESPGLGKKFLFTWTISGHSYAMSATGITCIECVIRDEGGAIVGGAIWTGKLALTGAEMEAPTYCALTGTTLTTKPLRFEADYMEAGAEKEPERWIAKVGPTMGETDLSFEIVDHNGGFCPGAGTVPFKGNTYGEFKKATGTFEVVQEFNLSPSISFRTGSSWQVGTVAPLQMTGALAFSVGESYFGVK